jgi:hypothetical protein
MADFCVNGNEFSSAKKAGIFIEKMGEYYLLKKFYSMQLIIAAFLG